MMKDPECANVLILLSFPPTYNAGYYSLCYWEPNPGAQPPLGVTNVLSCMFASPSAGSALVPAAGALPIGHHPNH